MKAIILKSPGCPGINFGNEQIQIMGIGETESQARQAAYAKCNHGHNSFDQEWFDKNEILLDADPDIATYAENRAEYPYVIIGNGRLEINWNMFIQAHGWTKEQVEEFKKEALTRE